MESSPETRTVEAQAWAALKAENTALKARLDELTQRWSRSFEQPGSKNKV